MTELMRQQNCQKREGKQETAGQGVKECCSMPAARMHRNPAAAEHRACQRRRDEHSREQQGVHAPCFATLVRAAGEDEVTTVRFIGPVVSPRPLSEGRSQLW